MGKPMMHVVVGATGNTGRVVADRLLRDGKKVRVIGRNPDSLQAFRARGAETFVGSVTNKGAMRSALKGATAVYTMVPPGGAFNPQQPLSPVPASADHYEAVRESLVPAVADSGATHVVNLSSIGAHLPEKSVYLRDFHLWENALSRIRCVNVLHLRAGFFMEGLFDWIGQIIQTGTVTGFLNADLPLPLIAASDVGAAAADAISALEFDGIVIRELLGERDLSMNEAVSIIRQATGLKQLRYVQMGFEEAVDELRRRNVPEESARRRYEMRAGVNDGSIRWREARSPRNTTPTSFEKFVSEIFVPALQTARTRAASG
jgi:uncharacterized protein YbjT (DUF2867 family)